MAKLTLFNGKRLNRKPRNIEFVCTIFLDRGMFRLKRATFYVPGGCTFGLSIGEEVWIEAMIEDGKCLVGDLLPDDLTKREMLSVSRAGLLY